MTGPRPPRRSAQDLLRELRRLGTDAADDPLAGLKELAGSTPPLMEAPPLYAQPALEAATIVVNPPPPAPARREPALPGPPPPVPTQGTLVPPTGQPEASPRPAPGSLSARRLRVTGARSAAPVPLLPELGRAALRGVGTGTRLTGLGLEAMAERTATPETGEPFLDHLTGVAGGMFAGRPDTSQAVRDPVRAAGRALAGAGGELEQAFPARGVTSLKQLREDPSLDRVMAYLMNAVGSGAGTTVPAFLGAAAAAPFGASGYLPAFLAAYPMSVGSVVDAAGLPDRPQDLASRAMAAGVPHAMLETLMPTRAVGRALRGTAGGLARRIVAGAAEGAVEEGAAETLQSGIEYATPRVGTRNPFDWREMGSQMLEGGVQGGLAGMVLGAGAGIRPEPAEGRTFPSQRPYESAIEGEYEVIQEPRALLPAPPTTEPPGGPSTVVPRVPRSGPPSSSVATPTPEPEAPVTPSMAPPAIEDAPLLDEQAIITDLVRRFQVVAEEPEYAEQDVREAFAEYRALGQSPERAAATVERALDIPDRPTTLERVDQGLAWDATDKAQLALGPLEALKTLAVDEGSVYADDDPEALLEGGRSQAAAHYFAAREAEETLRSGKAPSGRTLTAKQRDLAERERAKSQRLYEQTLEEVQMAFGTEVADQVRAELEAEPAEEADPTPEEAAADLPLLSRQPAAAAEPQSTPRTVVRLDEGGEKVPRLINARGFFRSEVPEGHPTAAQDNMLADLHALTVQISGRFAGETVPAGKKKRRHLTEEERDAAVAQATKDLALLKAQAVEQYGDEGREMVEMAEGFDRDQHETWRDRQEAKVAKWVAGQLADKSPREVLRAWREMYRGPEKRLGEEMFGIGIEDAEAYVKDLEERLAEGTPPGEQPFATPIPAAQVRDTLLRQAVMGVGSRFSRPRAWLGLFKREGATDEELREALEHSYEEMLVNGFHQAVVGTEHRAQIGGRARMDRDLQSPYPSAKARKKAGLQLRVPGQPDEGFQLEDFVREARRLYDIPYPEDATPAPATPAPTATAAPAGDPMLAAIEAGIREAYERKPDDYGWPASEIPTVARRMAAAVRRGKATVDSPGMRRAAKKLGIKPTLYGWHEYVAAHPEGEAAATPPEVPSAGQEPTPALPSEQAPAAPAPPSADVAALQAVAEDLKAAVRELKEVQDVRSDRDLRADVGRVDGGVLPGEVGEAVPDRAAEAGPEGGSAGESRVSKRGVPAPPAEPGARGVSGPGAVPAGSGESGPGAGIRGSVPDAGTVRGRNVRLTPDDLSDLGGPKTKARQNLEALRVLQTLRTEGRPATADEQQVLARYVGWGQFPQIVREPVEPEWAKEQAELKALVTPEEYEGIRGSILNAHYTSPEVIGAMWQGLERLGVKPGAALAALEPSMGVGHFLGLAPSTLDLRWTGVELDTVTGQIARALYPQAEVRVQGFEKARLPRDHFDLVVGNVPFGNYPVADPAAPKYLTKSIHNYFIARSVDLLRPGGVAALITSRYTLDGGSGTRMREYVAGKADLVAAFRLPHTAFKANAGTDVVTDLLILRRRAEGEAASAETWRDTDVLATAEGRFRINEYFARHPEHILGTLAYEGKMYRVDELTVLPEGDLPPALRTALDGLPPGLFQPVPAVAPRAATVLAELPAWAKLGGFYVHNGDLVKAAETGLVEADVPSSAVPRVRSLVELRDQTRELLTAEVEDRPEEELTRRRKALNRAYDAFVKKYGPINKEVRTVTKRVLKSGDQQVLVRFPNLTHFDADPDQALVTSLERKVSDDEAEEAMFEKADLLERRVQAPRRRVTKVSRGHEALALVLDELGRVDMPRVAQLLGRSETEAVQELGNTVFEDPETGGWELADLYLSGNVKAKLAAARDAAAREPRFAANVTALEAVQPPDLLPSQIGVNLGAPWIEPSDIESFLTEVIAGGHYGHVQVQHQPLLARWAVEGRGAAGTVAAQTEWGTARMNGVELLEYALNGQSPVVYDKDSAGSRVRNEEATTAAQEKLQQIKERFSTWIWEDAARSTRLVRRYNDDFNVMVNPADDGSHLTFPGMASHRRGKPFQLLPHQKNAVWRFLKRGNTGLFHVVGSGKTYTIVASVMEAKRLGLARKPMVVVPNHMIAQWAREFLEAYPSAQILVATEKDLTPQHRKAFLAKVAAYEWDAVLVKYTQFERIPMSPDAEMGYLTQQLRDLEAALYEAKAAGHRSERRFEKALETAKKRLEVRLAELRTAPRDDLLAFEELGVDLLAVDEADNFKNLFFQTNRENVGSGGEAKRATDLYLKTRFLNERYGERSLILATGTPISNSIVEAYTMQRFLQPTALAAAGLEHFDAWASMFGQDRTELEMNVSGTGFKPKTRFSKFVNVGELGRMVRQVADFQTVETLEAAGVSLPRPEIVGGEPELVTVPAQEGTKDYLQHLRARYDNMPRGAAAREPGADNALAILTDGRKASLDLRLVQPHAPPGGKVMAAADRIVAYYKQYRAFKGTQLVFADEGINPDQHTGFSVYEELRRLFIERGIPKAEIGLMSEVTTDEKKDRLFADVRAGKVRVLVGSTEKMGAGTNVQDRLVALHHLTVRFRPRDIEQREGRILRRGNQLYDSGQIPGVHILRYVTEGSLDSFMWGLNKRKAAAIAVFQTATIETREVEDADEGTQALMAAAMAAASGDPRVMEQAELDLEVKKLQRLRRAHQDQIFQVQRALAALPGEIASYEQRAKDLGADAKALTDTHGEAFRVTIEGKEYRKRVEAGERLATIAREMRTSAIERRQSTERTLGTFAGLRLSMSVEPYMSAAHQYLRLEGQGRMETEVLPGASPQSMYQILEGMATRLPGLAEDAAAKAAQLHTYQSELTPKATAPFPREAELEEKRQRLGTLNAALAEEGKKRPEAPTEESERREPPSVTLHSFVDPVTPIIEAIRRRRERRAKEFEPLAPSSFPDIEDRWKQAEGIIPPSLRQRMREKLQAVRAVWRKYPELDQARNPQDAMVQALLVELEGVPHYAEVVTLDHLARITEGLTPGEMDTFTRVLALRDILRNAEEGHDGPVEADGTVTRWKDHDEGGPFGYESLQQVRTDLTRAEQAVAANTALQAALARRQAFARALTTALVEHGLLPDAVLRDDRYYHRQILEYLNAESVTPGTGAREVRIHRKGFQRERTGSRKDFNTRYVEAEFEWAAQARQLIQMAETLEKLKAVLDIAGNLRAEARARNLATFYETVRDPATGAMPHPDPLHPYRQKIAVANGKLYRAIANGNIRVSSRYDGLVLALHGALANDEEFNHPLWWSLLDDLLTDGGDGAREAATIFKAIAERERFIRTTLGEAYINWRVPQELERIAPEGYVRWQPERGNYMFPALTVGGTMVEGVLPDVVDPQALKEALVLGGPKETWIIPEHVAGRLDQFRPPSQRFAAERGWVAFQSRLKAWMLLSPFRAAKYNLNNLSGDMDAGLFYPGIFREVPRAVRDLVRWMYRTKKFTEELEGEMHALVRRRVLDNTLTVEEIPDIVKLPEFERMVAAPPLHWMRWVAGYWRHVRKLTTMRENVLRLAAYRYFAQELHRGRHILGASLPTRIQAAGSPEARAALLATDLIGNYGETSEATGWISKGLFPFFRWQEVNSKRYWRLFRNIPLEQASPAARVGKIAGSITARLGLKAAGAAASFGVKALGTLVAVNVFFILATIWNRLFFRDEDDELRRMGRQLHVILGRNADGSIRHIRLEGAWADLLEWLDLADYPQDVQDVARGESTWQEKVVDAVKGPVARVVNMWEPITKTMFEMATGRSVFPSPWESRPIRDRAEHVARLATVEWLYDKVTGKPVPPGKGLSQLLLYTTDPGEAAYYQARDYASRWRKAQGKADPGGDPTERSNALYYWRQALKWGDEKAANRWLQRYQELGGTTRGLGQSLARSAPLGALARRDRLTFLHSLSPAQRATVAQAEDWYARTYHPRVKRAIGGAR